MGARMKAEIRNLSDALEFIGHDPVSGVTRMAFYEPFQKLWKKPLGHNTWIECNPLTKWASIILHNTAIITFRPLDGESVDGLAGPDGYDIVTLNSGGYRTVTTKARMNSILGYRWTIYQKDWDWFVWDRLTGITEPYEDGMTLLTYRHKDNQNDADMTIRALNEGRPK